MITRMQWGLVMLPFLLLAALSYVSLSKDMGVRATPLEVEVYRYRTGTLLSDSVVQGRPKLSIPAGLSGPLFIAVRGAPETVLPAAERYRVSFILISETDKRAIINNAIVREGDILDNRKVSRIEKDRVGLTIHGRTTWLEMEEQ